MKLNNSHLHIDYCLYCIENFIGKQVYNNHWTKLPIYWNIYNNCLWLPLVLSPTLMNIRLNVLNCIRICIISRNLLVFSYASQYLSVFSMIKASDHYNIFTNHFSVYEKLCCISISTYLKKNMKINLWILQFQVPHKIIRTRI